MANKLTGSLLAAGVSALLSMFFQRCKLTNFGGKLSLFCFVFVIPFTNVPAFTLKLYCPQPATTSLNGVVLPPPCPEHSQNMECIILGGDIATGNNCRHFRFKKNTNHQVSRLRCVRCCRPVLLFAPPSCCLSLCLWSGGGWVSPVCFLSARKPCVCQTRLKKLDYVALRPLLRK